jgi:mlo protein
MGSSMKPTIFNDRVVNALRKWHNTAKKRIKQNRHSSASTPAAGSSPVHLLRAYKGDLDSIPPTSPRMSSLNIEDCEMGPSRNSPSNRHNRGQEERGAHGIEIHSTNFSFRTDGWIKIVLMSKQAKKERRDKRLKD